MKKDKDPQEFTIENAQGWANSAAIFLYVLAFPAALGFVVGLASFLGGHHDAFLVIATPIAGVMAALLILLGLKVRSRKRWARSTAMFVSAISLLIIPYGTICGFFILAYLGSATEAGLFESVPDESRNDTATEFGSTPDH